MERKGDGIFLFRFILLSRSLITWTRTSTLVRILLRLLCHPLKEKKNTITLNECHQLQLTQAQYLLRHTNVDNNASDIVSL